MTKTIRFRGHTIGHINPFGIIKYILIIFPLLFTALPLIYVVSTAFKPIEEILRFPPQFFVRRPTGQNFSDLVTALSGMTVPFLRYIFNSLLVSVCVVFGTIIVSSMGAFALTKHKVPFGNVLFMIIISSLMFSSHVTQIPTYLVVKQMGLLNSYGALIIPKIAVAYNMFLMKQFCEQIPNPLLESARIEGAGEIRVFLQIVMPLLRPAWAALAVFSFASSWNDYFGPLIYITKEQMRTLPLALQSIGEGGNLSRAGAMAAATFIITIPTVVVYTLMQKQLMKTMIHSGIK